jgi:hypothetical protein
MEFKKPQPAQNRSAPLEPAQIGDTIDHRLGVALVFPRSTEA